jgi:hypothetical protein
MHPKSGGDRLGPLSCQRQQDRPCPIRLAAVLRLRQAAPRRPFRSISRQFRFSRHVRPPQPSSQKNAPSLVKSRAGCLAAAATPLMPAHSSNRPTAQTHASLQLDMRWRGAIVVDKKKLLIRSQTARKRCAQPADFNRFVCPRVGKSADANSPPDC